MEKIKVRFTRNSPHGGFGSFVIGDVGHVVGFTKSCAVVVKEDGSFVSAELGWIEKAVEDDAADPAGGMAGKFQPRFYTGDYITDGRKVERVAYIDLYNNVYIYDDGRRSPVFSWVDREYRLATDAEVSAYKKRKPADPCQGCTQSSGGCALSCSKYKEYHKQDPYDLTEFEGKLRFVMDNPSSGINFKFMYRDLFEIARKQLQAGFDKELDQAYKNQDEAVYSRGYQEGYKVGFQAEVSEEDIQKASARYADEDQSVFFDGVAYGLKRGYQEAEAEIMEKIAGEINVDDVNGFCYDEIRERHLHGKCFDAKSFGLECYRKGIQDTLNLIKKGEL